MKKVIIIGLLFLSFNAQAQTFYKQLPNDLDSIFTSIKFRELSPSELKTVFKSENLLENVIYCESEFILEEDLTIGINDVNTQFIIFNSINKIL